MMPPGSANRNSVYGGSLLFLKELGHISSVSDGAKLHLMTATTTQVNYGATNPAMSARQECWFAAYTNPNHEKRIAAHFVARGVNHFLPLYSSLRRWKDRRVRLDLPLFPGYIFVHFELSARLKVLEVPGVVRLVGFNGTPCPLPSNEIETLRTAMAEAIRFEPHPLLSIGSRVRIVRGPLAGAEGILVRKRNNYRVVLTVNVIARSAAVEVDASDIQRIF